MRTFTLPTPDSASKLFKDGCLSHFRIFDSVSEMVDFANIYEIDSRRHSMQFADMGMTAGVTHKQAAKKMVSGDLALAAKSDALLAKFETAELTAGRHRWIDDTAGGVPNVPAYIAGQPLAMRNRRRIADERAPIKVVVDVGAAGEITPAEIEGRGAAILALVRVLSIGRPVELWACAGLDADASRNASWSFVQIDTAPLDLARAAFILTHPAAIRRIFWACAMANGFQARTPYSAGQQHAPYTRDIIAPAFDGGDDLLVIPRARSVDDSIQNPTAWLAEQIKANAIAMAA